MRFVCDSCRAQYMISDDKVSAKGVKVRCKKCGYVILVRRPDPDDAAASEESTRISQNPFADPEGAPSMPTGEEEMAGDEEGLHPDAMAPGSAGAPMTVSGTPPSGEGVLSDLADDEIGAVFDQVLGGGSKTEPPEAAAGGEDDLPDDSGDDSTRVVSMDLLRKLASESEEKASGEEPGGSERESAGESVEKGEDKGKDGVPTTDWFVAVDDEQVGPLTLDKLKDMWDRGEVGAESLCWRAGFPDWTPLSEVAQLASVLAPRPAKPVIVAPAPVNPQVVVPTSSAPVESVFSAGAGVVASGGAMQMAPGSPVPTESGAWKPSAASALASLAMQEVEALSKPPPKVAAHEELPSAPAKGLLDLPPPEVSSPANGKAAHLPVAAPPGVEPEPPRAMAPSYGSAPAPAYSPYAAPPPPAGGVSKKLVIGGIAAAAGLFALVVVLVVVVLVRPEPQVVVAPPPGYVQQPAPPAGTQQVPPGAVAMAQPPAAAQPPPAAAQPPPAVAQPPPAADQPPAAAAQPPPEVKPALPPPPPLRTGGGESVRPSRPKSSGSSGSEERSAPPPRKVVDPADSEDDFDREFGGSSGGTGRNKPGTGYIPPAPGGGATLERLGQSDIMAVVVSKKAAIVNCVSEQRKRDPGLSGKLVIRWTIQTSGRTTGISVQSDEFKSTYMASCITGLIKGWTFPRHRVQGDPINFPFTF